MVLNPVVYRAATVKHQANNEVTTNKRIPRGWSAVPIGMHDAPILLIWPDDEPMDKLLNPNLGSRLRFSVAIEIREEIRVEAYLLQSGTILAEFDVKYAYVFSPFEIELDNKQTVLAIEEGVGLRIVGDQATNLWIFDELGEDQKKVFFMPHLMQTEDNPQERIDRLKERMMSFSSLQPFGWFEGCVLDGLYDLGAIMGKEKAQEVIDLHLQQFILENKKLHFEDLHGRPSDGRFSTNESTLPVAIIAKRDPLHPLIERAMAYWPTVLHQPVVTAECTYTIAYPMAVIAKRREDDELARTAIHHVLLRRDHLMYGDDLYGIVHTEDCPPTRAMGNWARSWTWYMLGMLRTWSELNRSKRYTNLPGMNEIKKEFQRIAEVVIARRESCGLWSCFLGETETGIETSGSAGIAAALALGVREGLLPATYLEVSKEALQTLVKYLTPDGILSGVCQHNCGGLALQTDGYRILSQMGMGLMAQLYAAVHEELS